VVTGYKAERSVNCNNEKKEIECREDGTFGADAVYKYSYCMPRDGTSVEEIINKYHP
jgi:hypothetical protein